VVVIEDEQLPRAMRFLMERLKLVAEPSGAITLAALMTGAVAPRGPTVAVLSGGNIEWSGIRDLFGRD
jgi:threonine dehydratase